MLRHMLSIVTYFKQRFIYLRVPRLTLTFSFKVASNHGVLPKLRFKSSLPTSNDVLSEHRVGLLSSLESTRKRTTTRPCDILELFVAQCTRVKRFALRSG